MGQLGTRLLESWAGAKLDDVSDRESYPPYLELDASSSMTISFIPLWSPFASGLSDNPTL
ncbi:hypothetical protein N7468_004146 [Penicillium chermesinum]|uniref:Uncharacterized protein n=1 Tax=Penicillium chermesinum TaxID=63820 RepID=A0A9W9TSH1_9EURO|nr:uncharacterized protein N7468_004146 [Penicillium chermesinum]KAJ5239527.1 hypothetical protein N7468_004146 [Penicillium chermesinum]KAJ6141215.1 hypothetical protein N7470_010111 [Penicillium chermesinum]